MVATSLSILVLFVLYALCCAGEAFLPVNSEQSNNGRDIDSARRPTAQNETIGFGYWGKIAPPTTMAPFLDQSQQGLAARAANVFKRTCSFTDASRKAGNCKDLCCTNGVYGWCCNSIYVCGDGVSSLFCKYASIATSTLIVTGTTSVAVTTTEARSSPGTTVLSTITSTVVVTITRSDLDTATEVRTITTIVDPRKRDIAGIPGPTQAPAVPTLAAEVVQKERQQQQPLAVTDASSNQSVHGRFLKRQEKTTPTVTTTRVVYVTTVRSVTVTSVSVYAVTSTTETTITSTSTSAVNARTTVTRTTTFTSTRGVTPAGGATPGATPSDGGGGAGTGGSNDSGTTTGTNTGGSSGLSTGAKAGIGVGAGLGALLLGLLAAFLIRRRRKQRKAEIAEQVNSAVLAATGGHNSMASPAMTDKYAHHSSQAYPHSNGTMSPPPASTMGGYEMEGSQVGTQYPQSWNGRQGYEMAATQSPVMAHAQPMYSPVMQHPSPVPDGTQNMPHYGGQQQAYEMYHEPAGHR